MKPPPATFKPAFLPPFPFFPTRSASRALSVSVKPPPPEFDFRSSEILRLSTAAVAEAHPELSRLAESGCLVRIEKRQFGPVPEWRSEFVEPEEVWLVGTTHISTDSGPDVGRVVRALRPDNVVVELCRSRAGIMYTSDDLTGNRLKSSMFSFTGGEFFGAISRSINLGGQTALALRVLLAVMSSKISSDVNRPFGDEFRAARKAAEEVGAQIVLGDRPIEITLERAWNSLDWTEKLNLVSSAVMGITSSPSEKSRDELEGLSVDVSPFQMYERLSSSYPSLLQPLIHERDTYLAWSLKRSKAVNNCKRVVGVIGKGHLNGVIYALTSDQGNLRFRDLAGKSPTSGDSNRWVSSLVKGLIRDTIIGIVLWALLEYLKPEFSFPM